MTHQDLKEAAMKATPGPWQLAPDEYRVFDTPPPDTVIKLVARVASNNCQRTRQARCNAEFIALANPTRILSLIEDNERMREALAADNATLRLYMGELSAQEICAVRAAFNWVLARAALKEKP